MPGTEPAKSDSSVPKSGPVEAEPANNQENVCAQKSEEKVTAKEDWALTSLSDGFKFSEDAQLALNNFVEQQDLKAESKSENLAVLWDHLSASSDPSWTLMWVLEHAGSDILLSTSSTNEHRRATGSSALQGQRQICLKI